MYAKRHYSTTLYGKMVSDLIDSALPESSALAGGGVNYVFNKCRKLVGFIYGEKFIGRVQEQLPQSTQALKL